MNNPEVIQRNTHMVLYLHIIYTVTKMSSSAIHECQNYRRIYGYTTQIHVSLLKTLTIDMYDEAERTDEMEVKKDNIRR